MKREELKDTIYSILFRQIDDGSADELIEATEEIAELFPLPPAEGAEDFLKKYTIYCKNVISIEGKTWVLSTVIPQAMQEFATLHAQRIADKMKEANQFILDIAGVLGIETDGVGFDGLTLSIDDFKEAADKMVSERLLNFIHWLRYRNFTDDTTTDEDWLSLYHNDPDIPE